jgi:hypothetical protein
MNTEEFNLSELINENWTDPVKDFIYTEDVKEFIRLLKDKQNEVMRLYDHHRIGFLEFLHRIQQIPIELAGDKLT